MSAPRKYDQEFRDRAVRMYRDQLSESGIEAGLGARKRVCALLDLKPETLRGWVEDSERAEGIRPPVGKASDDSEEVKALK